MKAATSTSRSRGCLVCGNKATVKSHIFPRALMHDLRGDDPHLYEALDSKTGTRFLQSGPWDRNILCSAHEAITARPDDYAVEFCRSVVQSIHQNGHDGFIQNSNPSLLARFSYQCIWRFAASQGGRGLEALGRYAGIIQSSVFEEGPCTLPFLIARNHLRTPIGSEATIAIAPFPIRFGDIRAWLFTVSGLQFYVKLDRRPFPADGESFSAHDAKSVRLFQLPPRMAHEVPILQKILSNMVN